MAKILVTGATGFIGNYVVSELLRRNHEVVATSKTGEKARNFDWYPYVTYLSADFSKMDTGDVQDYAAYFQQPDKVIHLAWPGLPNYRELFHFEENLYNDFRFLKNLITHGVKDITITGTCFEYGMAEGCLSEEMPSDPQNSYGLAKDTLRKFLQQLQQHQPLNLKWVRLFYMYGKGQNPGSLLSQLDNALENNETVFNMSGGEQQRDYLPVEDVAYNLVEIAMQDKVTGIINCCSGKPVSVKELVRQYLLQKGKVIDLNLGIYPYATFEPMNFWGSIEKLKQILNKQAQ